MTKRYSALLTALFASLMLSQAPAQANGLDDIVARGTLKVAVPQDFPPFGSVGPDMKPRGLDIDTAKLLADQLKVKLELTPVNSTNRIPFLTTGKVDLVISSLVKNAEREKVIDFSKAYAPFYLAVVRKGMRLVLLTGISSSLTLSWSTSSLAVSMSRPRGFMSGPTEPNGGKS